MFRVTNTRSETRAITEPAGALALAGLKRYIMDNRLVNANKKFVAVVSGANMNFDRLRFVSERAELGEGREALLSVDIPEKPGRYMRIFDFPGFAHSKPQFYRAPFHNLSPSRVRVCLSLYCRWRQSTCATFLHDELRITR